VLLLIILLRFVAELFGDCTDCTVLLASPQAGTSQPKGSRRELSKDGTNLLPLGQRSEQSLGPLSLRGRIKHCVTAKDSLSLLLLTLLRESPGTPPAHPHRT